MAAIAPESTTGPPSGPAGGALTGTYPNPTLAVDMATQAELDAHGADTTSVHGIADTAALVLTNDARLSDSRPPSGAAGGVLSGTYPNPGFASDLATQAELDAHSALISGVHGLALNNLTATTVPTVNDDSGDGYGVGSIWVNTALDLAWQAVDVTPGAAIWSLVTSGTYSSFEAQVGEVVSSLPPLLATGGPALTSGRVFYVAFQARETRTVSTFVTRSRGTAAGATPTLCRTALCTVAFDATGLPTFTKVAQSANDTVLWAGTFAEYARAFNTAGGFPASYQLQAGSWYAFATLCVTGATAPILYGTSNALPVTGVTSAPSGGIVVTQSGQTDIPASHVSPTRLDGGNAPWGGLY